MNIRAAGILIENHQILLIDQDVTADRRWSLPGGKLEEGEKLGDISRTDTNEIRGVQFIPLSELVNHGFGAKFQELALNGFPDAGSYMGEKKNIGL